MPSKGFSENLRNPECWLFAGKLVGVGAIGLFAGQAISYTSIIMPALRKFAAPSSLAVWCEAYHTAAASQVTLVTLSSLCLGGVYYKTKSRPFLYASMAMAAIVPYTLALLMPINKELLTIRKSGVVPSDHVEALLLRWDSLHFVRTAVSIAALGTALFGVLGGGSCK